MQYLRQHHPTVKISVEVEKPGREGLQDLAALADVAFYSKSWAQVCYSKPSSGLEAYCDAREMATDLLKSVYGLRLL